MSRRISFTVRPYQPEDEAGLLHAWNCAMWADPISAATWRSVYLTDPNFRRDLCLVAVAAETVVGFVLAFIASDVALPPTTGRDAWVVGFGTLPTFRRHGVATQLFDKLANEIRTRGADRAVIGPYIPSYVTPGVDIDVYGEAVRFLESWGASTLSMPLSMKTSLTGYRPPKLDESHSLDRPTATVSVRQALSSDILPCIEFVHSDFPHWIPDVTSVASRLDGGYPRMESLVVAIDGNDIVGFAIARGERFGPFGVRERMRGHGIGGALLSATLLEMRANGFHCAWFLWTSDRAARLYRIHGFDEVRRFALMAKDLST